MHIAAHDLRVDSSEHRSPPPRGGRQTERTDRFRVELSPRVSPWRPIRIVVARATYKREQGFGSDDHATSAANLFSLIASCRLHTIDAEQYLAEVIRVMPYWPRARYIELAPKYWARTRARIESDGLARPLGPITVPAEQETPTGGA
jgi:IS66 C-terminal element